MASNPPLPEGVVWDAPPEPVKPAPGQRQGGVILTDPTVEAQERRSERGDIRAEESLDISLRGEARAVEEDRLKRIDTYRTEFLNSPTVKEFRDVEGSTRQILALAKGEGSAMGDLGLVFSYMKALDPGSVVREGEFATAQNAAGVPGRIRNAYNQMLRGERLNPEQRKDMADTAMTIFNTRVNSFNDFASTYRGLIEGMDADPDEHGVRLVEPISALEPTGEGADDEITDEGGDVLTERDRELQSRLREAYAAGASLEELKAITAEYPGATFPIQTQEELDAARAQGRSINVNPSGRKEATSVLGITPESEAGAYFIGAANALVSGELDEIVGALGGDAAAAQAGKEALRERYPASSLVGEISGQATQLVGGGAAAKALGAGAKTLGAMEIAQSSAYGAGEANDNRLLGAGLGAGGALAGQQLAKRLLEPGAKAVISKIAQREGIPEEVVEKAAREALEGPVEAPSLDDETLALARQAVGWGPRSAKARKQLADMVQADPEAKAAMERLGIELPPDVLSDNAQVKNLTGLARSQPGSEAQAAWQTQVGRAARDVEEAVTDLGASRDVAQVSDDVFNRYKASAEALEAQADLLRTQVNEAIDTKAPVDAQNLQAAVAGIINDLGGIEAAKKAMTGEERRLLAALGEGEVANKPTYAYLERLRQDIGQALNRGKGPWVDTNEAALKKYYAALAEDRVAHVRQVGGDELAEKLSTSNSIFSEMYQTRQELVDMFGKDLERGIAPRIMSAITSGSARGDVTNLRRIIGKLPEDLRKDAVLAGLLTNSLSKSGSVDGFSFTNFAKLYRGLRQNKPVYKEIRAAIGPEAAQVLNDVYALSRRIADADSRIERTGRALGGVAREFNAESLVSKVLNHSATRVGSVGGATLGGSVLGPEAAAAGAMGTAAAIQALSRGGKTRTDQVHNLLSSGPFRELVEKADTPEAPKLLNRLAGSREYNNWATRVLGLQTPEQRQQWLREAFTATGAVSATPNTDTNLTTIEVQ